MKSYDAAGLPATYKTTMNGNVMTQYSYQYDGNGSLIHQSELVDGIETVITHEYNENDELVQTITTRIIPESSYVHRTETALPETGHGEIIENKIEVQESYTYINDVNQSYTQVLTKISDTGYDNYYYGNRRIFSDEAVYSYDGMGSVERRISNTGSIMNVYQYHDYGNRNLDSVESIRDNEYGFRGEAHTFDGMIYLRARYYDAERGVFLSADSYRGEKEDLLSQNRYTYCKNNPYKYHDPSGHDAMSMFLSGTGGSTPVVTEEEKKKKTGSSGSTGNTNNKQVKDMTISEQQKMANDLGYQGTYIPKSAYEDYGYTPPVSKPSNNSSNKTTLTEEQKEIAKQLGYEENSSITEEDTGKFEASDVGTTDKIITTPKSYNQPFGVDEIAISSQQEKLIDVKDMSKLILSGTIMAGIGLLSYIGISALTAYVGISTTTVATTSAIGSSITTGYAGTYVNAGINAAVENISLEQYASNLGYTDYDEFKRDLKFDAELNGLIGGMVSATAIISTDIITTSIMDDVVSYVDKVDEIATTINGLPENIGFSSYKEFKNRFGAAESGYHWHHIVEQSQIQKSGFTPEMIHNTSNLVQIEKSIHNKISGYYNTKSFRFTGGLSVRDWLANQSFIEQYNFGVDVIRKYGGIK